MSNNNNETVGKAILLIVLCHLMFYEGIKLLCAGFMQELYWKIKQS